MRLRRACWCIAGAGLVLCILLAVRYERHVHRHLLHPGDRLIPITVATMSGARTTIAPRGRPIIINVFATWCVPCREEMPGFAALARILQRRGIEIEGIDQEESADEVEQFARQFSLSYPIYIDESNVAHDVLGARMIPNTIYVDARGIIRWQHAGPLTESDYAQLARSSG